jgi:hypothetical protein
MNDTTYYPTLREGLSPAYAAFSDEEIDGLVEQFYGPGVSAADLEGFFDDLKRGFAKVGGAVKTALPGMAQGAMAGSALGPWGMLAGAVAGGAGSALSRSRNPTLSGIGRGIGTATNLASSFRGGGAAGGIGQLLQGGLSQLGGRGGAGSLGGIANLSKSQLGGRPGAMVPGQGPAQGPSPPGASANALLGMLARPEVGQALTAALMPGLGRQSVQVGQQQVGVQSILSALGNLAGRAASEMTDAQDEELPEYFYNQDGELAIDPAESHQRTDRLLTLMALTAPIWAVPRPPVVVVREREPEYTAEDADADAVLWDAIYSGEIEEDEAYV